MDDSLDFKVAFHSSQDENHPVNELYKSYK